jgi:predicted molibdopterin-dependent oxidoreductase YjgC
VPSGSGFRRLPDDGAAGVTIEFDGRKLPARAGDSVAAALLAAGHLVLRTTPADAAPRGPYCMMGACFDCLVEVDGVANVQACMTPVRDGMRVRPMEGARRPGEAGGEKRGDG